MPAFTTETIGVESAPVLKIIISPVMEGGPSSVQAELRPYMDHPRVVLDFTPLTEIRDSSGVAFVEFLLRRGHTPGRKTRVYGVRPEVEAKYRRELFMLIEPKERAADESAAVAAVSN